MSAMRPPYRRGPRGERPPLSVAVGSVTPMPVAPANGIEIYYDDFGDPDDPALILLAGLGSQLLNYPDELCLAFVDRGMRVVRMDNRDVGLSTHLPEGAGYSISDMAADVVGLMDHLGIEHAHVWGSSMGGVIAQVLAIEHPDRTRSIISVQSGTGEASIGEPADGVLEVMLANSAPAADRDEAIEKFVRTVDTLVNNPAVSDSEAQRIKGAAMYDRSYDPSGVGRQLGAMISAPPRIDELRALTVPALVIHGNRDPLIGIDAGRRTAELIPRSTFVEIDGMGHDLTPVFWSQYVDAVVAHVAAIETAG
jgi:pimeloyl-ACP methyl ester carboxylesterase